MKKTIVLIVLAAIMLSTGAQARGGRTTPDDCAPNSKNPDCTDSDDPPKPAPPPPPAPPKKPN